MSAKEGFRFIGKRQTTNRVVDYLFAKGNETKSCVFTSTLDGKWNGKFLYDGAYGADSNKRFAILDMIYYQEQELTRLLKEQL